MIIWHTTPETVAFLVVMVLLLSSSATRLPMSMKDRIFHYTLVVSLIVIAYNISVDLLYQLIPSQSLWVYLLAYTVLYLSYPIALNLLLWYVILFVGENAPKYHAYRQKTVTAVCMGLYALYVLIVILNITTGWVFSVDMKGEIVRHQLNSLPYILSAVQIVAVIFYIVSERSYSDKLTRHLYTWLPVLILPILILQVLFPDVYFAGNALAIALLSVYLNLQTRKYSLDTLTHLPNRVFFQGTITRSVRKKRPISVLLISLDDFKTINDTFSLRKGDAILIALSDYLKQTFPEAQSYRYSGDELALTVPGNTIHEKALQVMERFLTPWEVEGISASLHATFLEMTFPCTYTQQEDPLVVLDYALRIAKTKYKGKPLVFDSEVLKTIRKRSMIVNSLNKSLSEGSLRIVYQPIVDITQGKPIMYEALLRMHDTQLGEVRPGEFIPIAEEIDIIDQLTLFVVKRISKTLCELIQEGREVPAVAINFSASHFSNREFIRELLDLIQSYAIPQGKIFFEITEHTFSTLPYKEIIDTMKSFSTYGIHFNLDDFGMGYSNFSHLLNLPFRYIKIDKSLLWNRPGDISNFKVLSSMTSFLKDIGYDIILEGVETPKQMETIQSMKFTHAQGFYFSRPLEQEEFVRTCTPNTHFPLD